MSGDATEPDMAPPPPPPPPPPAAAARAEPSHPAAEPAADVPPPDTAFQLGPGDGHGSTAQQPSGGRQQSPEDEQLERELLEDPLVDLDF